MFKTEIDFQNKEEKSNKPGEYGKQAGNPRLKFKVRFDYKGNPKPARFFFGRKKTEEVAQEIREQQVALWQNIPLQGVYVDNIDLGEIYSIYDEDLEEGIAFAPLELMISADSLEDLLRFIMKEEFRKIEILEPQNILLNNKEAERLLFKINEFMQQRLMQKLKEIKR